MESLLTEMGKTEVGAGCGEIRNSLLDLWGW